MDFTNVLTPGSLAAGLLELVKLVIRYFKKDPEFDFPVKFYVVAIPVLNYVSVLLLALMGVAGYSLPTDWGLFATNLIQVFVGSLLSVLVYNLSIKPMKEYSRNRK